jgi:hypothetical protein
LVQQEGVEKCLEGAPILHPSVSLHAMSTNALSIWNAIDADEDVPEVIRWEQPQALLVWRKGLQPHFKSLDAQEAAFLQDLAQAGATIASVARNWGDAGRMHDHALLGTWLASWWSDEVLASEAS